MKRLNFISNQGHFNLNYSEADIENRLVVAKREGEWERDGMGVWD